MVLAFVFATIGSAVNAEPTALPSSTIEACSEATALDSALLMQLSNLGWQRVNMFSTRKSEFVQLFTDGFAAATGGTRTNKIDWEKTLKLASDFSADYYSLLQSTPQNFAFTHENPITSVLLVYKDTFGGGVLRCLYSGRMDPAISSLMDIIADMDVRAGLRQATANLQIANQNEILPSTDVSTQRPYSSLQLARFTGPMDSWFGRPARVELGFSFFKAPIN